MEQIRASRREAGLHIEPETAEVTKGLIEEFYYGVEDSPRGGSPLDWEDFARAPESDIWVAFEDLPAATRETLSARQRARELEAEQFLATVEEAARQIDPAIAVFARWSTEEGNPYGVEPAPWKYSCIGKTTFVRAPESDIWVAIQDLPEDTYEALYGPRKTAHE
jgi:hypothetical protein